MNYCKEEGCDSPVENKDTGLCATHSKAMRKAAQVASKPVKKYKIAALSKKGAQRKASLNKTYDLFDRIMPHFCSNCGSPNELTHSHMLPQGQYKALSDNVYNILFDCYTCHDIYEHGDLYDCEQLNNWPQRIAIIQKLAPVYFFRRFGQLLSDYLRKNPGIKLKTQVFLLLK